MKDTTNNAVTTDVYNPIIIIDKPEIHHEDRYYISLENTLEAQSLLSPEAFYLYMNLVLHDDKAEYMFMGSRFCFHWGYTLDMYMAAYNELLENAYLTPTTHDSHILYFHDKPLELPCLYTWDEGKIKLTMEEALPSLVQEVYCPVTVYKDTAYMAE